TLLQRSIHAIFALLSFLSFLTRKTRYESILFQKVTVGEKIKKNMSY
ncbi:MAG: hypothetical protein ACI90V_005038, partial [Bacillariaceae sp.]